MRHEKIKVDKAACAFKIWALLNVTGKECRILKITWLH